MPLMPTDQLKPGMTVAKKVASGEITIIGAGIILSGRHIAALKERHIGSVEIEADADAPATDLATDLAADQRAASEQLAVTLDEVDQEVDAIFAAVADDPVMTLISERAKAFLRARMSR